MVLLTHRRGRNSNNFTVSPHHHDMTSSSSSSTTAGSIKHHTRLKMRRWVSIAITTTCAIAILLYCNGYTVNIMKTKFGMSLASEMELEEKKKLPHSTLGMIIKRTWGGGSSATNNINNNTNNNNTWKLVDWTNPVSPEEESKFTCEMVTFRSIMSGKEANMCVHGNDGVSGTIRSTMHLSHCDVLPKLWNDSAARLRHSSSNHDDDDDNISNYVYVEIGANIGSCIMEMLLGTNAQIIAFEPHPMNVYNIKKTVSQLDKSYQDRLLLFPIGLGHKSEMSTIYSATGNMGNSIIGKIVKDNNRQQFEEKNQFTVFVERLDSILNSENIKVGLVKLDAQGFECNVLEGMGPELAQTIDVIKLEYAKKWLDAHECTDLLPRISKYSFDIYTGYANNQFSGLVNASGIMRKGFLELYALNNKQRSSSEYKSFNPAVAAEEESSLNQVAYLHSLGLFNDMSNKDWEQLRTVSIGKSWYAEPDNPLADIFDPTLWNKNNMKPTFACPRMGAVGVGGQRTKFICNPKRLAHRVTDDPPGGSRGDCLIYSIGSAGDFSFEDDIAQMHNNTCEIHVFDPADWSRKGDETDKNIHYHAWGMKSTYDNSSSIVWPKGRKGGFKTFPETMELLKHHANRTIDLLKIDCEGCELSTMKDWIHLDIRQILMEVHGVPTPNGTINQRWYKNPMDISEYYKAFSDNGFALYSKDPVNDLVMELSFIKLHRDFWAKI